MEKIDVKNLHEINANSEILDLSQIKGGETNLTFHRTWFQAHIYEYSTNGEIWYYGEDLTPYF